MKISTNYKLKLPEGSDPVQISDLSGNFTELDRVAGQLAERCEKRLSIVSGTLTGSLANGTKMFQISVGKKVKALFASADFDRKTSTGGSQTGEGHVAYVMATESFSGSESVGSSFACTASIAQLTGATTAAITLKASSSSASTYFTSELRYMAIVED